VAARDRTTCAGNWYVLSDVATKQRLLALLKLPVGDYETTLEPLYHSMKRLRLTHGRRSRGTGGQSPQNLDRVDANAIAPPPKKNCHVAKF